MMPIFASFFSGPGYREEAGRLVASLEGVELEHDVQELPDLGSWAANVARKPLFVAAMMLRHAPRSVCWVDADAVVRRRPVELEELAAVDVAAHVLEHPHKAAEVLTGTLYFAWSPAALIFAKRWIDATRERPGKLLVDQVPFEETWRGFEGAKLALPAELCWIFDTSARYFPGRSPAIEHFQASRRLRSR